MTISRVVLDVPGISCRHCKMAIEGAVGGLTGVNSAVVDVDAKSVSVEFDLAFVSLDAIAGVVRAEGYEVVGSHACE